MGLPGRKSAFEELEISRRYSELSPLFFKALREFLKSDVKSDKQFAMEQLGKAYTKMIPQQIGGDPENPIVFVPVELIQKNGIAQATISSDPKPSGEGQAPVQSS